MGDSIRTIKRVVDIQENGIIRLDDGLLIARLIENDKINFNTISKRPFDMGGISDGYHTFNELYDHRMVLFALICNTYVGISWRSWQHHDGTMHNDYFIVGIDTPKGQYSYHYHKDCWDNFKHVKELEFAPKWDGHQPKDINRLLSLCFDWID